MDETLDRLRAALSARYDIDRRIGQGGMATVYGATDLKHNRQVAIKVLRPELAATIGGDRFLREIEVSAGLQHPHVVPLYDSGDAGGVLYYVMPFVAGESLRDRLTREGQIPFQEAVTLIRQVASALAYAHEQGIVHRDIKPENILLSGGLAVVADFGIARALKAAAANTTQMTGLGLAIGTPAYMSPEQATASEVDARSDQYSLACVFYEMITGKAPFAGPTMQAVLTQSLTGPRPRLSRVSKSTPPEADAPVARALSADPAARYPSVVEFGEVAMQMGDKAGYQRYMRVLASSGNELENRAYQGAGEILFGQGKVDTATSAAMLRYGGSLAGVIGGLYSGEATSDTVAARYGRWQGVSEAMPAAGQVQYFVGKGVTLAGLGRFQAAQVITDSLMKLNRQQAYGVLLTPLMLGFAPPDYAPPEMDSIYRAPRSDPFQVYILSVLALNRGDRTEGARLLDSLLAHQDPQMPPKLWDLVRAAKGWTLMIAGDTAGGIPMMQTGLENMGAGWNPWLTAPLRLQLAAALAQRPATREQGMRLLQYGFVTDVGVTPVAEYALGRAQEAAGNRPAAAEAYGRFLRLWDRADPILKPRVDEVKEALKRVTGEPR